MNSVVLLKAVVVAFAMALAIDVVLSPASADTDPGNSFQRFRFPWVDDATQKTVNQSVNQGSHTVGLAYAIDWNHAYNTFLPAVGEGGISFVNSTNPNHSSGLGYFVVQAVVTADAGTKYIIYSHLCYVGVTQWQSMYQGQYIGRSGNTGIVSNPPPVRCDPSYQPGGWHLHFQFDNTGTANPLSSWQFGQTVPDQVSRHSANTTYLPNDHVSYSNNAGPGFYSFNGNNGGSPTIDSWLSSAYISRGGLLSYGATKALSTSTFTPCGSSTRWVHGCSLGSWGGGVAQTFESKEGYQRALIRRSNFTSVYSVQRDILYAYHFWAQTLAYPTGNESGTTTVSQFFNGGYIVKTLNPCKTVVYNNGGGVLQTYTGVCN